MTSQPVLSKATRPVWPKPLRFGLIAGLACVLAALLGEAWLSATKAPPPPPPPPPPPAPPQAVSMVLDTSGSMEGSPLEEMKMAAQGYIARQNLARVRIGIASFGSESRTACTLNRDRTTLQGALSGLTADGLTRMDLGLNAGFTLLPPAQPTGLANSPNLAASAPGQVPNLNSAREIRSLLLFTDGYPEGESLLADDTPALTLQAARQIRQNGVRIVAIGATGADTDFLAQVTGDTKLVFTASAGQFGEAFKQAEQVLAPPVVGRGLVETGQVVNYDLKREIIRSAVWTGLLGLAIAAALGIAQALYVHQTPGGRELLGMVAGTLTGLAAGATSQLLFDRAGDNAFIVVVARMFSWSVAGGLLGLGVAPFVPNLRWYRAGGGGLAGGCAGAIGFLMAARLLGTTPGGETAARLAGAGIVGFAIGATIMFAEVAFRAAWLRVAYGPIDAFEVSLGAQPVAVGSDRSQCRVLVREAPPIAARYSLENGQVVLEHGGARQTVAPGDLRRWSNVEITVLTSQDERSPVPVATNIPFPQTSPPLIPEDLTSPALRALATPVAPTPPARYNVPLPPTAVSPPHSTAPLTPPVAPPVAAVTWRVRGPVSFSVAQGQTVGVGRVQGNDVIIADEGVSSRHARFTATGGALSVVDLGSTNGTFVNGTRLAPNVSHALQAGDRLVLGRVDFVVEK